MTGYGYRESRDDNISLSIEVKGYNSRYLETDVYLPPKLSSLEPKIKEQITKRFKRGKIELGIRLREFNSDVLLSVNQNAAKTYYDAILGIAENLGLEERPSLSHILAMEGVLEQEKNRDGGKYWEYIEAGLSAVLDQFEADRIREGKHTEEDILKHIGKIESSLDMVASYAPELEASIKENLRSRFSELLGNQLDENRILAETAVLLMKYTISEEISRLRSHLKEFRSETASNPAPGKKLDFLCQEINREINTIGSKNQMLEVSRAVVNMKDCLENIREQLRNVE
ncbi:YicC family protein [Treponema sp. OttesenSCG-928-L16]|nr:YicC family protein [Treponema sp. OttesenSCG-928-L16]